MQKGKHSIIGLGPVPWYYEVENGTTTASAQKNRVNEGDVEFSLGI